MENTCESCLTSFPELKVITSQFKCGICYEFIKTPMSTSCGHSYCSICIRTWITTKQACPTCQNEVRDETLRNNLALENSINPYVALQTKLHELCKKGLLKNLTLSAQLPEDKDPIPKPGQSNSTLTVEVKKPPKTPEHNRVPINRGNEPQNVQSPAKIPSLFLTSPKSQNQQRPKTDFFTSPTSSSSSRVQNDVVASSSTQSNNISKVPCPVCSVEIPERNINIHLDKCLTFGDNTASPSPRKDEIARREPLKKMVYHMMSDKEVRKKLQEHGLSTKGNRTQIVNRLQRYTVLYNSECDSLNPRPVAEIRKQLEKDEEALTKAAPSTAKMFRISKTADATEIEEFNKQYMSEHKSEFDDLIRQVRERNKKQKAGPTEERSTGNRSPPENAEDLAWSVGTAAKRNRMSDEDSDEDEFTSSKKRVASAKPRRVEDNAEDLAWSVGTAAKRNRMSDEESDEDEFTSSKKRVASAKSRRVEDSDDDLFVPNSRENSQETSEKTTLKNGEKQLSPISVSSGEENVPVANGNVSPVFSRSPNEKNGMKSRLRKKKKKPGKTVEISPIEEDGPKNKKKKSGRRAQSVTNRIFSRTPSLSPKRLERLGREDRENSETPEMLFEKSSRRSSQDSDEMEDYGGDDNLSQLVSLLNESGSEECPPKRATRRRSKRKRSRDLQNPPKRRAKQTRK